MSNTNTGGPAFPVTEYANNDGCSGMTLRDYFAAKVMQTLLTIPAGTYSRDAKAAYEAADAMMHMRTQAQPAPVKQEPLARVDGDLLPPIGAKVLIHLASQDKWVEHTVVGYYAFGAHEDACSDKHHRVYVRVRNADGTLNARILRDVRHIYAAHNIKEDA